MSFLPVSPASWDCARLYHAGGRLFLQVYRAILRLAPHTLDDGRLFGW